MFEALLPYMFVSCYANFCSLKCFEHCTRSVHKNTQISKVPYICGTSLQFVLLYRHPFSSYRVFCDKAQKSAPQTTSNTRRSSVSYICISNMPGSQIFVIFAPRPAFLGLHVIFKYSEWPHNDQRNKIKDTPYVLLLVLLFILVTCSI